MTRLNTIAMCRMRGSIFVEDLPNRVAAQKMLLEQVDDLVSNVQVIRLSGCLIRGPRRLEQMHVRVLPP